jgi:hypothetical protein
VLEVLPRCEVGDEVVGRSLKDIADVIAAETVELRTLERAYLGASDHHGTRCGTVKSAEDAHE